jgi:kynurenine formamidase
MIERRVVFDFAIEFSNGGGIQGQDFRLDIDGPGIADEELADAIVRDMRLLMVERVRILRKVIVIEPHKRPGGRPAAAGLVDLSHPIHEGMPTYAGLPGPAISTFMSHAASRAGYAPGTEFHIGAIQMVGNTGTTLDAPFHRFLDAADLARLELEVLANLDGVGVRTEVDGPGAIGPSTFAGRPLAGRALLVHTGWAAHWGTPRYLSGHPYLTEEAAQEVAGRGAALVGIDSLNVDDTSDPRRPVHSILLDVGIPIVEHLTGLERLPDDGFRFSAAPPRVAGLGTFPVRAFGVIDRPGGPL